MVRRGGRPVPPMVLRRAVGVALRLAFGGLAGAAGVAAAADAAQVATTVCAACHGPDGNSVAPVFPRLAGQDPTYLARQLRDFKTGRRKSAAMGPVVAELGDGDIEALAQWFAAQKPTPVGVRDAALAGKGKVIYDDGNTASGVPACGGCHLPDGAGNERYPRIASQQPDYTVQQLLQFKSGARSNDKGKVMRAVAQRMTEAEIAAVAEYLAGM